ncbi:hypothetical protein CsSME_00038592 [Camellia sinensis var. sinensis]
MCLGRSGLPNTRRGGVHASLLETPLPWASRLCIFYALLKAGLAGSPSNPVVCLSQIWKLVLTIWVSLNGLKRSKQPRFAGFFKFNGEGHGRGRLSEDQLMEEKVYHNLWGNCKPTKWPDVRYVI